MATHWTRSPIRRQEPGNPARWITSFTAHRSRPGAPGSDYRLHATLYDRDPMALNLQAVAFGVELEPDADLPDPPPTTITLDEMIAFLDQHFAPGTSLTLATIVGIGPRSMRTPATLTWAILIHHSQEAARLTIHRADVGPGQEVA